LFVPNRGGEKRATKRSTVKTKTLYLVSYIEGSGIARFNDELVVVMDQLGAERLVLPVLRDVICVQAGPAMTCHIRDIAQVPAWATRDG
jgi:hypothetical protein